MGNIEYKAVCKNLKTLRKASKFTQQQVSDALGIDRSTYAYYEAGKTTPGFDTIDKILKLYNINYTDLFEVPELHVAVCDPGQDNKNALTYLGSISKMERSILIRIRMLSPAQREAMLDALGGPVEDGDDDKPSKKRKKKD